VTRRSLAGLVWLIARSAGGQLLLKFRAQGFATADEIISIPPGRLA